jgi:hypothetical protein
MKITVRQLRRIIKEEIGRMDVGGDDPRALFHDLSQEGPVSQEDFEAALGYEPDYEELGLEVDADGLVFEL